MAKLDDSHQQSNPTKDAVPNEVKELIDQLRIACKATNTDLLFLASMNESEKLQLTMMGYALSLKYLVLNAMVVNEGFRAIVVTAYQEFRQ